MVSIKLTKGQVFTFDYILSFVMFIIIVVIAGQQLINIIPSNDYPQLYDENIYFSSALLQPGYPDDWTPSNVLVPGIATSNRLDADKLDQLELWRDMTQIFYQMALGAAAVGSL